MFEIAKTISNKNLFFPFVRSLFKVFHFSGRKLTKTLDIVTCIAAHKNLCAQIPDCGICYKNKCSDPSKYQRSIK
jgi:hypothetical protein